MTKTIASRFIKNVIVFIGILLAIQASAQKRFYRVKNVDGISFVIPPKAKIAQEGLFNHKTDLDFSANSRFRYQYVIFQGIKKTDYTAAVNEVQKAEYLYAKEQQTAMLQIKHCHMRSNENAGHAAATVFMSDDGDCIAIQLDYSKLVNASVEQEFGNLSWALLKKIFELEVKFAWPPSICQSIVQKIFELVPAPQSISLARFGYVQTTKFSLLLLDPKMKLFADNSSLVSNPLSEGRSLYHLDGVNTINFFRDKKGEIKQLPYLSLDRSVMPASKIAKYSRQDGSGVTITYYLIAGSADLELSAKMSASRFLALYQPVTKSGNPAEKLGDDDTNDCCESAYDCTSQIVLSDDISSIFAPAKSCMGMPLYENVSVLGERNTMRAYYTIFINGNSQPVLAGTTLSQLINEGSITESTKVMRVHHGRLVDVKMHKNDITLLPTDHLTTH